MLSQHGPTYFTGTSPPLSVDQNLIFKLEEEEKPALLLLLPKVFAEIAILGSTSGLGCRLVVAAAQIV
jgi:hypothetical protein